MKFYFRKHCKVLLLNMKCSPILGIWLIGAYCLSIGFTAYLFDFMIIGVPVIKIDSLEELSQTKDIEIHVREDSSLETFIQFNDSDLAKAIKPKLKTYDDYFSFTYELMSGLRNGSFAFVETRMTLLFNLEEFAHLAQKTYNDTNFLDLMHVSEESGGLEPYFLTVGEEWIQKDMNQL